MSCTLPRELIFPAHRSSSYCISFPLYDGDTCPPTRSALPGDAVVWLIFRKIGETGAALVVKTGDTGDGHVLTVDDVGGVDADVELSLTLAATAFANADEGKYDIEICVQQGGGQLRSSGQRTKATVVTSAVIE